MIVAISGWRSGEQGVDPGEQVERWDFVSIHQGAEADAPFFRSVAIFSGENHGRLGESPAHGELATGPAQPCLEIRAVVVGGEHGGIVPVKPAPGQEDTRGFRPRFPAG